jgi:thiol-disulfide isomerase/thioredoxin
MTLQLEVPNEAVPNTPQASVETGLDQASELQSVGKLREAAAELEKALATARATPYEIEFQTRIRLGMMLSDVYLSLDQIQNARDLLAVEAAFAERVSQIMAATGTPAQKRAATSGYLQIRDRATQLSLIGQLAPEISISTWLNGAPVTLAELRDRVVLLEFWATWCKPCQEMFPKLKSVHEQAGPRGLEIIAVTRHYMAYGGTAETVQEELQLMRATLAEHDLSFAVGVAPDEKMQATYGANGLPTCILIDRGGVVRYAGPGAEDPGFEAALQLCLGESA